MWKITDSTINDVAQALIDYCKGYCKHHEIVIYYFNDLVNICRYKLHISVMFSNDDGYDVVTLWNDKKTHLWHQPLNRPIIILSRQNGDVQKSYALIHAIGHLFFQYKWYPDKKLNQTEQKNINAMHHVVCSCGGKKGYIHNNDLIEKYANSFANVVLAKLDVPVIAPVRM